MGKGSHLSGKKILDQHSHNKCIKNIDGWALLLAVKGVSILYFHLKTIFIKDGNALSSESSVLCI